ncbi:MAG: DUF4202 domain-containing protein [Chloroflexota bacterium]
MEHFKSDGAIMNRHLLDTARQWVIDVHPGQSKHLLRSEHWLNQFAPDASLAVQMATLTHDMERAFPGDDAPSQLDMRTVMDTRYCLAHGARSARFVSEWLSEQGADRLFVAEVSEMIVVHEYGGWPEADLVQAADSVSFLDVNAPLFIEWIPTAHNGWSYERTLAKFEWMFERITVPSARALANPLYQNAVAEIKSMAP